MMCDDNVLDSTPLLRSAAAARVRADARAEPGAGGFGRRGAPRGDEAAGVVAHRHEEDVLRELRRDLHSV